MGGPSASQRLLFDVARFVSSSSPEQSAKLQAVVVDAWRKLPPDVRNIYMRCGAAALQGPRAARRVDDPSKPSKRLDFSITPKTIKSWQSLDHLTRFGVYYPPVSFASFVRARVDAIASASSTGADDGREKYDTTSSTNTGVVVDILPLPVPINPISGGFAHTNKLSGTVPGATSVTITAKDLARWVAEFTILRDDERAAFACISPFPQKLESNAAKHLEFIQIAAKNRPPGDPSKRPPSEIHPKAVRRDNIDTCVDEVLSVVFDREKKTALSRAWFSYFAYSCEKVFKVKGVHVATVCPNLFNSIPSAEDTELMDGVEGENTDGNTAAMEAASAEDEEWEDFDDDDDDDESVESVVGEGLDREAARHELCRILHIYALRAHRRCYVQEVSRRAGRERANRINRKRIVAKKNEKRPTKKANAVNVEAELAALTKSREGSEAGFVTFVKEKFSVQQPSCRSDEADDLLSLPQFEQGVALRVLYEQQKSQLQGGASNAEPVATYSCDFRKAPVGLLRPWTS